MSFVGRGPDLKPRTRAKAASLEERFWPKVDATGDCWEWLGGKTAGGYGVIGLGTRAEGNGYAHRIARELLGIPVPDELVLDHFCKNHGCVNPDHTDPVTQKINVDRGAWHSRKL